MLDRRCFIAGGVSAVAGVAVGGVEERPRRKPLGVAGYGYRLPGLERGSRLLFQGDSITDMKWGRDQSDRNHYLGHSYVYLIAARLGVELCGAQLDFYNRGVSGNTVADLRRRWQADALEMRPDLLSVLVGTNDVGRGVTVAAFEADYRFILEGSLEANRKLRLVLLEPFVLRTGKLKEERVWAARRAMTDRMGEVVGRLAEDYHAALVRTQAIFDAACEAAPAEQWIWDGIHPLPQGHELIARHWLEEVSGRWPGAEKS